MLKSFESPPPATVQAPRKRQRYHPARPVPPRREVRGGRDDAPKLHVRLKWIAGNFVDDDTRHVFLQRIADVQRPGLLDLIGVDDIDAGGHLISLYARARDWRARIHHDPGRGPDHATRILAAAAFDAWRRPGHHHGRPGLNPPP